MYSHATLLKFIAFKIIVPFVVLYLMVLGLMFYYQRALLYLPPPAVPKDQAVTLAPGADLIEVATKDQLQLTAYFIPPKTKDAPILLVFHGNAALGVYLAQNFSKITAQGYGVLLAEYRGYGGNPGKPSEAGLAEDADAYLEYLETHYPGRAIIAYGQSLGSGVMVDLAARRPKNIAAVILEVPFDSILNVADQAYPYILFKKFLLKDQYLSINKIGAITAPKLFLLAGRDEVVGLNGGLALSRAAPEPKTVKIYETANHMNVFEFGADADILKFLEGLDSPMSTEKTH